MYIYQWTDFFLLYIYTQTKLNTRECNFLPNMWKGLYWSSQQCGEGWSYLVHDTTYSCDALLSYLPSWTSKFAYTPCVLSNELAWSFTMPYSPPPLYSCGWSKRQELVSVSSFLNLWHLRWFTSMNKLCQVIVSYSLSPKFKKKRSPISFLWKNTSHN